MTDLSDYCVLITLYCTVYFVGNSKWDRLVDYKGIVWAYLLHTWLNQDDTEVHVVQYERLISRTREELEKILNFVNVTVDKPRMECVMKNSQGIFKRNDHLNFNPYSQDNCKTLNRHMTEALPLLTKYNVTYSVRPC